MNKTLIKALMTRGAYVFFLQFYLEYGGKRNTYLNEPSDIGSPNLSVAALFAIIVSVLLFLVALRLVKI